jgi:hypothetical protein
MVAAVATSSPAARSHASRREGEWIGQHDGPDGRGVARRVVAAHGRRRIIREGAEEGSLRGGQITCQTCQRIRATARKSCKMWKVRSGRLGYSDERKDRFSQQFRSLPFGLLSGLRSRRLEVRALSGTFCRTTSYEQATRTSVLNSVPNPEPSLAVAAADEGD